MLAVALVCLLRTIPGTLDTFLNTLASNTRVSIQNEAGFIYPMPSAHLRKVRAVPGVVAATSSSWFGGAFEIDKGVTFPNFAVDADAIGAVYEDYEVDPKQLDDFRLHRNGAIVGREVLDRYHWKVGDLVTLEGTLFPVDLTLLIVGEIPGTRSTLFWFRRDFLEQTMLAAGFRYDSVGMIWARIDDADRVQPAMRQIDAMFRNSEAQVTCETEKSFFGNTFGYLRGFAQVIRVVTSLVALCIAFIAANTASMSVRERVAELAILKAMGFGRRLVFGTLLAEATLLSGLAGTLGAFASLGLALLLRSHVATWSPQFGPLTSFVVSDAILFQSILLAFFIGIASGALPAWAVSRRSVTDMLREVF
jgi:putative ABC transport system permease protein